MSDFYNGRFVKTRKIHFCDLCNRKIPLGWRVYFQSGMYGGEFYYMYLCNTCYRLQSEFPDSVSDECEGCLDSQYLFDSMNDYGCVTPYQLLCKLRKNNLETT